jgi:hypothetical protein
VSSLIAVVENNIETWFSNIKQKLNSAANQRAALYGQQQYVF